jgi:hypothetical protein
MDLGFILDLHLDSPHKIDLLKCLHVCSRRLGTIALSRQLSEVASWRVLHFDRSPSVAIPDDPLVDLLALH